MRAPVPSPDAPSVRVPFALSDDDPFHARTGVGPYVDIDEKTKKYIDKKNLKLM